MKLTLFFMIWSAPSVEFWTITQGLHITFRLFYGGPIPLWDYSNIRNRDLRLSKRRPKDGSWLCTTGFYMAKLDEIGYRVCSSGFSDVYETIQNPEFQNPAIGGIWENCIFLFLPCPPFSTVLHASLIPLEGPPNDLKILPMGILHDYMLCWTSLGPFRYPRGP